MLSKPIPMVTARNLVFFLTSACASCLGHAQPVSDTAICGGMTAIVATWTCGESAKSSLCTLWGVDVTGTGRWNDKSLFVVEGPKSVARVSYEEACQDGRCSRPEYSVCSTPVAHAKQTRLEVLLRPDF